MLVGKALLLAALACAHAWRVHDVLSLEYGARGDGKHLDTAALQRAIDAAGAEGGGMVLLRGGRSFVSGSLFLRSHTVLHVAPESELLGSTDPLQYPCTYALDDGNMSLTSAALVNGAQCEVMASSTGPCAKWGKLENVTLEGGGIINGQGTDVIASGYWDNDCADAVDPYNPWAIFGARFCANCKGGNQRPSLMSLMWIDGLIVRDLLLHSSAFWTLHPAFSTKVHIRGLTILSNKTWFDEGQKTVPVQNSDGIDLESCNDVEISDCFIRSGDDCIALFAGNGWSGREMAMPLENVVVRNISCGTEIAVAWIAGGVRNVTIEDSIVHSGHWEKLPGTVAVNNDAPVWFNTGIIFKTSIFNSGVAEDLTFRNIRLVGVEVAFKLMQFYPCWDLYGRNYSACRAAQQAQRGNESVLPHYRRISFENISVELAAVNESRVAGVGWFDCRDDSICEDISFSDVHVSNWDPLEPTYFDYRCSNIRGRTTGSVHPMIPAACFGSPLLPLVEPMVFA